MKLKKLVSVLCVGAMAASLLAGCGGSSEESAEPAATAEGSAAEEGGEAAEAATFDEMQTISMYGMTFYGDAGAEEVTEAVNEISEAAINVHVDYYAMDVATYMEQIGLMLSGGEAFDLVMVTAVPVVSFSTMNAQNELMGISEYLEEYAPDVLEMVGDYIAACTVDGEIYSVPCVRQYNTNLYMYTRKDILDELGLYDAFLDAETWTEIEDIMLQVKDAQDTLPDDLKTNCVLCNADQGGNVMYSATFNTGSENLAETENFDNLGDLYKIIKVNPETNTVENFYESEDYQNIINRVRKWYSEGLILKDAATTADAADTMIQNGVGAFVITPCEYGIEFAKGQALGREVVAKEICTGAVMTNNANTWGWAVPTTSENPEAACAFLNLMYTNADIENLFVYGIEGRDYELNEAGEAVKLADGVYNSSDWCFGNQFDAYPTEGAGSTFRDDAKADTEAAGTSTYFGCVVDTSEISNEITAVSNVLSKYQGGLESGTVDPAETYDAMISELQSAGVQTIIDYYQEALDEFLAQ